MPSEYLTVLMEKQANLAIVIAPSGISDGAYLVLEDYCLYLVWRAGGACADLFDFSQKMASGLGKNGSRIAVTLDQSFRPVWQELCRDRNE